MRGIRRNNALLSIHHGDVYGDVFCRQHVVDARTRGRLENPLGECVSDESLDLFRRLSLRTQLRDLQVARKKRAGTFGIHALWVLADRQSMLDDCGEAVLAFSDLYIA